MTEPEKPTLTPRQKKKVGGVVLILAAIIAFWTGFTPNPEHTVTADHEGKILTISCEKGEPVSGPVLATSVRRACERGWERTQDSRPWWFAGGVVAAAFGVALLRSVTPDP